MGGGHAQNHRPEDLRTGSVLSVLAAAVAWINERQADSIQNLVGNINKTYVPIYAALSDAQARSLEEALYVRRLLLGISEHQEGSADFARLVDRGGSKRQASRWLSSRWRAISLLKR